MNEATVSQNEEFWRVITQSSVDELVTTTAPSVPL